MYRPANAVPYVTVEADLPGDYQRYSVLDHTGRLDMRTGSDVEQKCCALQHWIFQWTNGNMLLTRLEGTSLCIYCQYWIKLWWETETNVFVHFLDHSTTDIDADQLCVMPVLSSRGSKSQH